MEELKLILQTLATMGEAAKTGFVWYLVIDRLIPTLVWGSCAAGLIYGVYRLFRGSSLAEVEIEKSKASTNIATTAILQLRRDLGIQAYPVLGSDITAYGIEPKHVSEVVEAVANLKSKGN